MPRRKQQAPKRAAGKRRLRFGAAPPPLCAQSPPPPSRPSCPECQPPSFVGSRSGASLSALRITRSPLSFSDLPNPTLCRLWLVGVLSHLACPPLTFFPLPSTPPLTFSQSVSRFLGQSWAEGLGCGVADSQSFPAPPHPSAWSVPGLLAWRDSGFLSLGLGH